MRRLLLGLFFVPLMLGAEVFQLFDAHSRPHKEYSKILQDSLGPDQHITSTKDRVLSSGDYIAFSNGEHLKLGRRLGTGNTTVVWELADEPGKAIRLPKQIEAVLVYGKDSNTVEMLDTREYLKFFVEGEPQLQLQKVPAVKVHRFLQKEYVIVDKIGSHFTFDQFISDSVLITPQMRQEMRASLKKFAASLGAFQNIGDFHSGQIVYEYENGKKEWKLLDWSSAHLEIPYDGEVIKGGPMEGFWESVGKKNSAGKFIRFLEKEHTHKGEGVVWRSYKATSEEHVWLAEMANEINREVAARQLHRRRQGQTPMINLKDRRAGREKFSPADGGSACRPGFWGHVRRLGARLRL